MSTGFRFQVVAERAAGNLVIAAEHDVEAGHVLVTLNGEEVGRWDGAGGHSGWLSFRHDVCERHDFDSRRLTDALPLLGDANDHLVV